MLSARLFPDVWSPPPWLSGATGWGEAGYARIAMPKAKANSGTVQGSSRAPCAGRAYRISLGGPQNLVLPGPQLPRIVYEMARRLLNEGFSSSD